MPTWPPKRAARPTCWKAHKLGQLQAGCILSIPLSDTDYGCTQNGWFVRENPSINGILGYPYFRKPTS